MSRPAFCAGAANVRWVVSTRSPLRKSGRPPLVGVPSKRGGASRIWCEKRFDAANIKVAAAEIEALVTEAVGEPSADGSASQADIRDRIDRVVIGGTAIQIQLSDVAEGNGGARTLKLPWTPPSPHRKREVIQAANKRIAVALDSLLGVLVERSTKQ